MSYQWSQARKFFVDLLSFDYPDIEDLLFEDNIEQLIVLLAIKEHEDSK
jgi:hypothetical protein